MIEHEKLPDTREALTHAATIGGTKIYITTGCYPDGRLGEVFLKADKEGAEMRLLNATAIAISVGLQHGIPLYRYTRKLKGQRLGTAGPTDDPEIPLVASILDYVAKFLEDKFTTPRERAEW